MFYLNYIHNSAPEQLEFLFKVMSFGAKYPGVFAQIAEINDHLYLSGAHPVQAPRLRSLGITHVINCTMEVSDVIARGITCTRIFVEDTPYARLGLYFDKCAKIINDVKNRGGKTLVHCVAGVSRSASLCMAYLMRYKGLSLKDAYKHVKKQRPVVHPNVGFFRQLIEFEKFIRGKTSVKMVGSPYGMLPTVYKDELVQAQQQQQQQHQSTLKSKKKLVEAQQQQQQQQQQRNTLKSKKKA